MGAAFFFAGRITFRHADLAPSKDEAKGQMKNQLEHFYKSLLLHGMEECDKPKSWLDTPYQLQVLQN